MSLAPVAGCCRRRTPTTTPIPSSGIVDGVAAPLGIGARPSGTDGSMHEAVPRLATADRVRDAAAAAGLTEIVVEPRSVAFADLAPAEMVRWRLGMPQLAGFVAGLEPDAQRTLEDEAIAALGSDPPVLERSVLFLTARVATPARCAIRAVRLPPYGPAARIEFGRLVSGESCPRVDIEMPSEVRRQPPRLERRAPAEPVDGRADRIEVVRPTRQRDDGLGEHDVAERSPLAGVRHDVGRQSPPRPLGRRRRAPAAPAAAPTGDADATPSCRASRPIASIRASRSAAPAGSPTLRRPSVRSRWATQ